jgi:hypothetical protein
MFKKTFAAVITFLCLMSGTVLAHHAPVVTGTGQAGPVLTTSAATLQKGKLALTLQASYVNMDDFSDNELHGLLSRGMMCIPLIISIRFRRLQRHYR